MDLTKTASRPDLSKYDFKILIDKSGSMATNDVIGSDGKNITRWKQAHEWSKSIAYICNQYDSDGIDIILFDDNTSINEGVNDSRVDEVFRKNSPGGSTNTALAIQKALPEYFGGISKAFLGSIFGSKYAKVTRKKPVILLIFTDGEPNSELDLMNAIIEITKRISSREEVGISFLQVGNDSRAKRFLKKLDDDLESEGAKFDIVNVKTYDDTLNMSIEDIFYDALSK